jgi:hypothetical protein
MKLSDVRVRWAAIGAAVAVTLGAGGLVGVNAAGEAQSTLVPVTPIRVLDTRSGDKVGNVTDGAAISLQVSGAIDTVSKGRRTVVPEGASAVIGNLTMNATVAGDYGGYATIYPCGERPDASNVNFVTDQTVANSVAVPLSSSGEVCIFVFGEAHVLLDISGYYTTTALSEVAAQVEQVVTDPLAEFECTDWEVLVSQGGEWVCTTVPGYELIEDANGEQFILYEGVASIEGVNYSFRSPSGFVSESYEGPGSYTGAVYYESADCSGTGYMVVGDDSTGELDPDTVFSGTTYLSGVWGDTEWARVAEKTANDDTIYYWRLDEDSTIGASDVGSRASAGWQCTELEESPEVSGTFHELVWLDESVTELYEPPFSRVSTGIDGTLLGACSVRDREAVATPRC